MNSMFITENMKYKIRTKGRKALAVILSAVLILGACLAMSGQAAYGASSSFEASLTAQGFPESYKVYLRQLHEAHPNWNFRAKQLDFTWSQALSAQYENANANTISENYPDAYKAVREGTYNFNTHTYLPKDGTSWVSASKKAIAFYMDPRNWLTEDGIFMFEPFYYDASYQSEDIVKDILKGTALPAAASSYYMEAAQQTYNGRTYSISPTYLATKTRIELGSGDTMISGKEFTYGGKKFSKCYNVYNIGAVDSADGSAATKGLVYAAGGLDQTGTSYLRPWNTLKKAVKGGAIYIAENFISNNQYSAYYERYNVLNGLGSIGTHQYATSVFCAATESNIMYWDYRDFGVLDEPFTFEIPVYQNMPKERCAMPSATGTNNCYLDNITVSADGKTLGYSPSFDRFTSTYTISDTVAADKLTIKTAKNDSSSKVAIKGNSLTDGSNKVSIKCTSSSGAASKTYYIKVVRDSSQQPKPPAGNENLIKGVENTTITLTPTEIGQGYVSMAWERAKGYKVDAYQIFRAEDAGEFGSKPMYTTQYGTTESYKNTKDLSEGRTYYYKVRGIRNIDGKTYYTKWSNTIEVTYDPETEHLIQGVKNTDISLKVLEQADGYVKLSWEREKGFKMDYYEIFRSTSPDYADEKKMYSTQYGTTTSYKNTKNLERDTKYYYRVRGARKLNGVTYYSQWSNSATVEYDPYSERIAKGVELTTLKTSAKKVEKGVKVSWIKSKGFKVDFYQIYRSTKKNSNYKLMYTTKYGSTVSYINSKSLTKGTRYYYKVRGVRIMEGLPYYTQWSTKADVLYE